MSIRAANSMGVSGQGVAPVAMERHRMRLAADGYRHGGARGQRDGNALCGDDASTFSDAQWQLMVRDVDQALHARWLFMISELHAAMARRDLLAELARATGEQSTATLTEMIGAFAEADLAKHRAPRDARRHQTWVEAGTCLARAIRARHVQLTHMLERLDAAIARDKRAVEACRVQLTEMSDLHERRERLMPRLAELVRFHVVPSADESSGVVLESTATTDALMSATCATLAPCGGRLGQSILSREADLKHACRVLDAVARHLITESNQPCVGHDGVPQGGGAFQGSGARDLDFTATTDGAAIQTHEAVSDRPVAGSSRPSLAAFWQDHINEFEARHQEAQTAAASHAVVVEALEAQRRGMDEAQEHATRLDLADFQKACRGATRFVRAVDDLLDALVELVR